VEGGKLTLLTRTAVPLWCVSRIIPKTVVVFHYTESELFPVSLRFVEELESIKTDFVLELDTQIKELVAEFADVTQEPQGLPHGGIFDHTIRFTA